MAFVETYLLDANDANATSTAKDVTLGGETEYQIYTFHESGQTGNAEISFEVSPDGGTSWMPSSHIMRVGEYMKESYICTHIRARNRKAEGSAGMVKVIIAGR